MNTTANAATHTLDRINPNIGLSSTDREGVVEALNVVLADTHTLYVKTRNYHWNITGLQFYALHELLEKQYNTLQVQADDLAERIRMLGGRAMGTMQEFTANTRLTEHPGEEGNAMQMMTQLLADHEEIVSRLRNDIEMVLDDHGDEGTGDLLIATMRTHEEMAWMLRATLSENMS